MKMDKNVKEKWLSALRNREYKQSSGYLRDEDGFCSLGVLGDVIDNSKWSKDEQGFYLYDGNFIFLSPKILPLDIQHHLSKMNDDDCDFSGIADYIEMRL